MRCTALWLAPLCLLVALLAASLGGARAQEGQMEGWFEFRPERDDFSPTALDCGHFIEAPTGKHGFLTVQGDRFVFEDGTPARFWGAQFGGGRSPEELDYAVRRLRKLGINIVRQHGLESLNDRRAGSVLAYSEQGFDRLDALIARLGQEGIYIILDVDYYLRMGPNDVPGMPEGGASTQFLTFFNEKVIQIKRQRMTDIFTHVNKYTGKRYCDDPTLAMVEICNEDSMFWHGVDRIPEPFRKELEDLFKAWLLKKYGSEQGLRAAWAVDGQVPLAEGEGLGPDQRMAMMGMWKFEERWARQHPEEHKRGQDQLRFFMELEDKYWQETRDHLRRIGIKVPICGTNWRGGGFTTRIHMATQARLDYIDRHGYWDHPQGEGNTKWRIATCLFFNQPMVKAMVAGHDPAQENNVGNLVLSKAWEQVLGKPMTVSEWNTCLPNEYSLEGTGLMAAYGMLQGWDGPLQFSLGGGTFRNQLGPGSFDMLGNPPQLLQYPAVMRMWHRHDVKEAEVVAETLYTPEDLFEYAEDRRPLPLAAACVGKVGYRFVDQPRQPIVRDISGYWDDKALTARSLTGELTWDASRGVVTIDTDRTQGIIGFLNVGPQQLKFVRADINAPFGALYVTSLEDDRPISAARRLLVTAVGQARNTGMEYEATDQIYRNLNVPLCRLKQVGTEPILLRALTGELAIKSDHAAAMRAWALDINGHRTQEVPLAVRDNAVVLRIEAAHRAVYYELAAQ